MTWCCPPFREAEFDVLYGEGISKAGSVLDAGADHGLIEKSGTYVVDGGADPLLALAPDDLELDPGGGAPATGARPRRLASRS